MTKTEKLISFIIFWLVIFACSETLHRCNQPLVAEINYVGCTNFEGNKICVYSGLSETELRSLTYLDPHFSKSSISPIARFKPDATGWNNACKFARSLSL